VAEELNRDLRAGVVTARVHKVCADKTSLRSLNERRILWSARGIVLDQPALPHWHPDFVTAPRFVQACQGRQ
jgi:hypothetical protein